MNSATGSDAAELAALIAARASAILTGSAGAAREIGVDTRFFEAGLTSLDLVRLHRELTTEQGLALTVVDAFQHPTPSLLAEHLAGGGAGRLTAGGRISRAGRRGAGR